MVGVAHVVAEEPDEYGLRVRARFGVSGKVQQRRRTIIAYYTRAPLRGRPTPPATLAQGKEKCN